MNLRSFFKSLALIGAAAAGCPGIFIPKFEPVRWKVDPRSIPNPNWVPARSEGMFIAEFKQAIHPTYREFGVLIFHKRSVDDPWNEIQTIVV